MRAVVDSRWASATDSVQITCESVIGNLLCFSTRMGMNTLLGEPEEREPDRSAMERTLEEYYRLRAYVDAREEVRPAEVPSDGSWVLINCRRSDTKTAADQLYGYLDDWLGEGRVFMDLDAELVDSVLAQSAPDCALQLVLVGQDWLTKEDGDGRRQLDDEDDPVRRQIELAQQYNIPIIPLLINAVEIPRKDDLPPMLQALPWGSSMYLRAGALEFDLRRLADVIRNVLRLHARSARVEAKFGSARSPRQVFICHSSGDKERVRKLYRALKSDNVKCWFDEQDLLPGQDWEYEIGKAIRASRYVLVCLTAASINKAGYIQKELRRVLDVADEQPEGSTFIIPVRLEDCEIPERLRRWQWVDLSSQSGYERLLQALK